MTIFFPSGFYHFSVYPGQKHKMNIWRKKKSLRKLKICIIVWGKGLRGPAGWFFLAECLGPGSAHLSTCGSSAPQDCLGISFLPVGLCPGQHPPHPPSPGFAWWGLGRGGVVSHMPSTPSLGTRACSGALWDLRLPPVGEIPTSAVIARVY